MHLRTQVDRIQAEIACFQCGMRRCVEDARGEQTLVRGLGEVVCGDRPH